MKEARQPEWVARFCGKCSCGCPELFVDHDAPLDRRILVTDDFGQRIQMSLEQFEALAEDIKSGKLDGLLIAVPG